MKRRLGDRLDPEPFLSVLEEHAERRSNATKDETIAKQAQALSMQREALSDLRAELRDMTERLAMLEAKVLG